MYPYFVYIAFLDDDLLAGDLVAYGKRFHAHSSVEFIIVISRSRMNSSTNSQFEIGLIPADCVSQKN